MSASARQVAGVLLKDMPRYLPALAHGGDSYLGVRNRGERLESAPAPEGGGFRCDWQWTSDLHAPKVFPSLGRALMRRALAAHPIELAAAPATGAEPPVSFLIGHRGLARLPQLLMTLESIAGQRGPAVECIVVEQDTEALLPRHLPPWVRYVHTPPAQPDTPYNRSCTFNAAAPHALGKVLVLHDNDMLVPADYAVQIIDRVARGYDVVNLKRFIFYLTQQHTQAVLHRGAGLLDAAPSSIVQNLEGGGSVAISREGFDRIGGMDESFVGWGGEDNEFWERASTLRVWPWANLPIVHLWHAPQPGKGRAQHEPLQHYRELSAIAPQERIEKLKLARSRRPAA